MTTTTTVTPYERILKIIEKQIAELNEVLGYSTEFDADFRRNCVTFGYIGNLGNGRDDRLWSVFLPHPGRVGTDGDRIGQFSTGDVLCAQSVAVALGGAIKGAKLARRS